MKTLKTDGVFIFAGMKPNLEGLESLFDLDPWGYVKTDAVAHTNLKDIFAVGDVVTKHYRQITTAVADGTIAAMTAAKELGS